MNKLQQLQSLDLETKIMKTKARIREWYYHFNGKVYVSFSGGKDSTVLLDLVRSEFPETPVVFVNTGLEYPEIVKFARSVDNIIELKPKMNFTEVIKKYGYPVISKEQSYYLYQAKNTKSNKLRNLRINGINTDGSNSCFKISKKWKSFLESDIKTHSKCCDVMKKKPFVKYEKETGRKPFIGTMAIESNLRKQQWNRYGCNAFKDENGKGSEKSAPLSFWTEKDIWQYIKTRNLQYSKIYDLEGITRTGCMFCAYGLHLEQQPNRFQIMKKHHPDQYNYVVNKLGLGKIVDFMNENCKCNISLDDPKIWEQMKL